MGLNVHQYLCYYPHFVYFLGNSDMSLYINEEDYYELHLSGRLFCM